MMVSPGQTTDPVLERAHDARSLVKHISDLMRSEYREMPCLCLTLPQAMRLWSLDQKLCQLGLARLVDEGFLELSSDGRYRVARHS